MFKKIGVGFVANHSTFYYTDFFAPDWDICHIETQILFHMKIEGESTFTTSSLPMFSFGTSTWRQFKIGKVTFRDPWRRVLTAYEINQMIYPIPSWLYCQLVETGLGDIKGNEGVYGLQRAFKIAGVKYIIAWVYGRSPIIRLHCWWLLFTKVAAGSSEYSWGISWSTTKCCAIKSWIPFYWAGFVLVRWTNSKIIKWTMIDEHKMINQKLL